MLQRGSSFCIRNDYVEICSRRSFQDLSLQCRKFLAQYNGYDAIWTADLLGHRWLHLPTVPLKHFYLFSNALIGIIPNDALSSFTYSYVQWFVSFVAFLVGHVACFTTTWYTLLTIGCHNERGGFHNERCTKLCVLQIGIIVHFHNPCAVIFTTCLEIAVSNGESWSKFRFYLNLDIIYSID